MLKFQAGQSRRSLPPRSSLSDAATADSFFLRPTYLVFHGPLRQGQVPGDFLARCRYQPDS